MSDLDDLADEPYCYLTTTGRVSGKPREIEIWFHLEGRTLYMLAESRRAQWTRNIRANPSVSVRIADQGFAGTARVVDDPEEDLIARRALPAKYQEGYSEDLTAWAEAALPVAVDLSP